jgi:ketosteroid isomerase-like protein
MRSLLKVDNFQEILTTIATGAKITSKGSYLIIFRRQASGSWQIVQQAWTGTAPPGASAIHQRCVAAAF